MRVICSDWLAKIRQWLRAKTKNPLQRVFCFRFSLPEQGEACVIYLNRIVSFFTLFPIAADNTDPDQAEPQQCCYSGLRHSLRRASATIAGKNRYIRYGALGRPESVQLDSFLPIP